MRRLTPLLTNLGVASVFRLILPVTLAAGGERYLYYTMSLFFPYARCPSYQCFRFLPALIPSLLPLQVIDSFMVTGFVCQVLAGTLLWHIAERVTGSRRVALLATAWFWAIWGPLPTLRDPLLIADPVQALWFMAALLLLFDGRYWAALPVVVTGAGVKESVVLAPMIYTAYLVLAGEDVRKQARWLAVLIVLPILAWVLVRRYLIGAFAYELPGDSAYLSHPYLFGLWMRELGGWPHNLLMAMLYIFAGFGSAWLLGTLGLAYAGRRVRALSAAATPAMMFLALYQEPHRAVASLPFVALIPAAIFAEALPVPLVAALVAVNAAFTIRMSATVSWLPRMPIILGLLLALMALSTYVGLTRRRQAPMRRIDAGPDTTAPTGGWLTSTAVVALALVLVVVVARNFAAARSMTTTQAPTPASVVTDDDFGTPGLAMSPDGERLAFVATGAGRARRIWTRPTRTASAEELAGTEGANAPFWSPDGRAIGFFADGRLKTIDLSTLAVRALVDAPDAHGGTWSDKGGLIVFAGGDGRLYQVGAAGGDVAVAIEPPARTSYRWPSFLPDGEHLLFVEHPTEEGEDWLRAGSIRTREHRRVLRDAYAPVYAAPGVVFFARWDHLLVQPFDTKRLEFFGTPEAVSVLLGHERAVSRAAVSASSTALAFATRTSDSLSRHAGLGELRWYDRTGRVTAGVQPIAAAPGVALAPDGQWATFYRAGDSTASRWNVARAEASPWLPGRMRRFVPLPSPDGRRIAFAEQRANPEEWQLQVVEAREGGGVVPIDAPVNATPVTWSPDGRVLLYLIDNRRTGDLWALPLGGGAKATLLVPGPGHVYQAEFSPDGRWLAYAADDRGNREIYVQPYPATGQRWIVSSDGGDQPRWRGDGRELIYVAQNRFVMAVDLQTEPVFAAASPRRLFTTRLPGADPGVFQYAMARNAGRFLIDTATDPEQGAPVKIARNWRGMLALVDSR